MKRVTCTFMGRLDMPAPAVRAYFYIPRIDYGCHITFVLDTGSEVTCLNGHHAFKLQNKMIEDNLDDVLGIGGHKEYYFERNCNIIFRDSNKVPFEVGTPIRLGIQKLSEDDARDGEILNLPSVIGRDIISKGKLFYDVPNNKVSLCFSDTITKYATREPI